MKCDIPGANVKVFGRAIHSLSKLGDELYFEPLDYGPALRTVNMSRSAYACFMFAPSFFTRYDDGQCPQFGQGDADTEVLKCKIGMKSCLSVFRSLSSLEKTVEKCSISLNMDECRLVFQMHCRHGIVKTHNLAFIECETLQAVFSKNLSPNVLTAPSKVLGEAVLNFQSSQEEVTLFVTPEKVTLKNYVEDEPDPKKVVHTELLILPIEFDHFQVGVDTDVTFCLKEFRAIIGFAEACNLSVSLHFEGPGKPIVCSIDSQSNFEANFVLATLAEPASQTTQTSQVMASQSHHSMNHSSTRVTSKKRLLSTDGGDAEQLRSDDRSNRLVNGGNSHSETRPSSSSSRQAAPRPDQLPGESAVEDATDLPDFPERSRRRDLVKTGDGAARVPSPDATDMMHRDQLSPVIPLPEEYTAQNKFADTTGSDTEDEPVPGTPPAKKFKSLFFGFSQSSMQGSQKQTAKPQASSSYQVLAEDTDDEDDE